MKIQPTMTPEQEAEWERAMKAGEVFEPGPRFRHGTYSAYRKQGCRCARCRDAHRIAQNRHNRTYRAKKQREDAS